jgi:hypothetical protein
VEDFKEALPGIHRCAGFWVLSNPGQAVRAGVSSGRQFFTKTRHGVLVDVLWTMMLIIRAMTPPNSEAEGIDLNLSAALPRYYSYLLRFWEERGKNPDQSVWRFSLENPQTAQRQSFADLNGLILNPRCKARPPKTNRQTTRKGEKPHQLKSRFASLQ